MAGLITVCLPLLFRMMLTPPQGMRFASWDKMFAQYVLDPPLVVLVPMWLALWFLLRMSNRVSITLRDGILHLPPEHRYHPRRIPVSEIILCRERPYPQTPATDLSLPAEATKAEHQVVWLAGYRGPGVQIGFLRTQKSLANLKTLLTDPRPQLNHILITVHFPCEKPKELMLALTQMDV
jgi:hypothetical protein